MPTIALHFPAGRYHATPWGSHVNEGLVEWPPTPWRLLRALLATGFAKHGWSEVPDDARRLVYELAQALPAYRLPPGQLAHTRHYMPVIEGRKQTTTKVFDAFICLSPLDDLLIRFDCNLSPDLVSLLESLVSSLGYFGRAESWADGRLVEDAPIDDQWCRPCESGSPPPDRPGGDQVPLLALLPPGYYDAWRKLALERTLAQAQQASPKKLTAKQMGKLSAPYPPDLLACLLADTAFHQQHGWSQAPGSRLVLYSRPAGTLEPLCGPARTSGAKVRPVEAALLALASDTVRGDLLPLMVRCLPQMELLHQALVSVLGESAHACPSISGRDTDGKPLTGHRHAHYLPLDLDEDGRMDHVLVHAPMGLDGPAQTALSALTRTWTKGSDKDIFVTCAGLGELDLFRGKLRTRSGRTPAILASSRAWSSLTPFVPPRHIKENRHSLEDQIRSELASRGLPQPQTVQLLDREEVVGRGLLRFVRLRKPDKPQPPRPIAFGLRLVFAETLAGPIALGYASHYGLGLFVGDDQG